MLVTVTNLKSFAINTADTYAGAVGGNRVNGLPFPFGWIGELAGSGTKQLAMHPGDLYHREVLNGSAQTAWEKWQQMIQAEVVSLAIATQTGVRALDEVFIAAV